MLVLIQKAFKEKLGFAHNQDVCSLFIDSKISLKAVLFYSSNKSPSVPLTHAVDMKETGESMFDSKRNKLWYVQVADIW